MGNHVFVTRCIDFQEILSECDLGHMLKVAHKQSKTELAKIRVDFANYKDYDVDQFCPAYFGMFVEWLAWHWLNHYGHLFNIQSVTMVDSDGNTDQDYGVDGHGLSITRSVLKSTNRLITPNSPVYIQVKGTLNKAKIYCANDGSRLPNFGLHAMSGAITSGHDWDSRYVIFTTGKDIHYTLDKMARGLFEVINYSKIKSLMNGDTVFLNRLRQSVGLLEIPVTVCPPNAKFLAVQSEIVKIEEESD